jgi:hypothetical protein
MSDRGVFFGAQDSPDGLIEIAGFMQKRGCRSKLALNSLDPLWINLAYRAVAL